MVSIIVPVWNKSQLTHQFLVNHWLYLQDRDGLEIIVIDNGSKDSTSQLISSWRARWGDRLRVISNEENRGFGPANNQGAEIAKGKILIFMSNDVIVSGDYISPIVASLQNHPRSLVGASLHDHDTGWNKFGKELIPYLAGWCVAMTKDTFIALGGWDERYVPSDYEDVDLSYTAIHQGRGLVHLLLPLAHISGVSATQLPDRQAMTLKHRELFKEKWRL